MYIYEILLQLYFYFGTLLASTVGVSDQQSTTMQKLVNHLFYLCPAFVIKNFGTAVERKSDKELLQKVE